ERRVVADGTMLGRGYRLGVGGVGVHACETRSGRALCALRRATGAHRSAAPPDRAMGAGAVGAMGCTAAAPPDGTKRVGAGGGMGCLLESRAARGDEMAAQKRGLGKGLGALIPTAPGAAGAGSRAGETVGASVSGAATVTPEWQEVDGTYFDEIGIGAITPNPRQPRQHFDEDALEELAASIREVGLLQPVVVRKVMPGRFELVMGERRWRACPQAGLAHGPAIVRGTPDDELLREALMENLHREQLNPLDEAAAYQQLLEDFSATHDELARKVGRSRPHISNTIRLLQLPPAVQRRVAAGVLSAGHARAL